LKQLFVRLRSATTNEPFAPPELRPAIVSDVLAQGSNLNDVVVAVLSEACGTAWTPRNRVSTPTPNDEVLALRVPVELLAAIDARAEGNGRTRQDEALAILCERYGLEFVAARKRNGPVRVGA
jgi:hypothetical protein